jgi:hypothetical protein
MVVFAATGWSDVDGDIGLVACLQDANHTNKISMA